MILCIYLLISSVLWVAFWLIISFLLWFKNSWFFFSFLLVRMQWYLPSSLHAGLEKSFYFSFTLLVTSLMLVLGQPYTFQFIRTCFKFTNLFPVQYKNTTMYSSFSSFPFVCHSFYLPSYLVRKIQEIRMYHIKKCH